MLCDLKISQWQLDTAFTHNFPRPNFPHMAPRRMRVAIAGTNELALLIAELVTRYTVHQCLVLSRHKHPQLENERYEILEEVDYDDADSLKFAVMGVHTIISTVTGTPQVNLIQAAVSTGVRRFIPAEFEGPPSSRMPNDPLDRSKKVSRDWLDHWSQNMQYTIINCGVLYERFAPGGLKGARIGLDYPYGDEGDYLVNPRNLKVFAPTHNDDGSHVEVCLTAAQDVAMLVVKVLEMRNWPDEISVVGERMTVSDLIQRVFQARGQTHAHLESQLLKLEDLRQELATAMVQGDEARQLHIHELIATMDRRYQFSWSGTGRDLLRHHQMIQFENWLRYRWANIPIGY